MSGSKEIRCAAIGYGATFNMGKCHAGWSQSAGLKFVAACDILPERCKAAEEENPGIKSYTDYKEMLAKEDFDLAIVILPHDIHASVTVDCLNAGKHVVCEKPMCLSKEEADSMINAAKGSGKMLAIFQNRRWDGDFMTIRELVQQGMIGDVVHVELCIGNYSKPSTWWRSDKKIGGGILYDWGAHMIDWTLHIVNSEPVSVFGSLYKGSWPDVTAEDHGQAIVKFANGATLDLQVSTIASVTKPKWRILGSKGGITTDWGKPITVTVDHEGHLATFDVQPKKDDWEAFYRNVNAHLTKGEELICKPEQSRKVIAIIDAAERSAATGKSESL